MIIYAPFIADTIPAFTNNKIIIPFSQNPAVNWYEVKGFSLKIKNYIDSKDVVTLDLFKKTDSQNINYNFSNKTGELTFENIKGIELLAGEYYKFQLSYLDDTELPYAYSSASVGKCIAIPKLELTKSGDSFDTYVGTYTTSLLSEPIYSYRFVLTDNTKNIIYQDSGEVLHNVDNDRIFNKTITTNNFFKIKKEVEQAILTYSVTTVSGYTDKCEITEISTINQNVKKNCLKVFQDIKDKENGCIQIALNQEEEFDFTPGTYVIERQISGSKKWDELIWIEILEDSNLNDYVWYDCLIEQGVPYYYSLKNSQNRYIITEPIIADFEDTYLMDSERQLNIKYNPKINSFKNNILEQKTDTIGNQYPFFFRNGQIKYKEFSISGLLSYLGDKNRTFMSNDEIFGQNGEIINTTNLTQDNIAIERKFKLQALEWLTNGEPKLFRSPTEGNYLVRLMNVSLSPNDTIGRMLHTFTATAYEIGENEIEDLIKNKIAYFPQGGSFRPASILGAFVLGKSRLGG